MADALVPELGIPHVVGSAVRGVLSGVHEMGMNTPNLTDAIRDAFTTQRERGLSSRRTHETGQDDKVPVKVPEVAPAPILNAMVGSFWQFMGIDGNVYRIKLQQKRFVEAYVGVCNGDGSCAVYEAGYKVKNARVAAAVAYENLNKPHIAAYLNSLLPTNGFNDENVTKQHLWLLNQDADKKVKAKAVEMYYKLKEKGGFVRENDASGLPPVGAFSLTELADRIREARQRGLHNEPPVQVDYVPLE